MNRQILFLILAIAIVVLSGAQAYQISELRDEFSGNFDGATSSFAKPQQNAGTRYAQQSVPSMVGGC